MPSLTISKKFECSPEIAFEVISDFPNAADYIEGITKVEMLTKGPIAVGTRVKETRFMMGREASEEMEVTVMDAPNVFAVKAFSHGTEYYTEYKVHPDGDGAMVTLTFTGTPKTFMAKVFSILFSRMISSVAKLMEQDIMDAAKEAKRRAEKA